MRSLLTLFAWLLISCQAFATCVVVVRTEQEILIGADSRRIKGKGDGTKLNEFEEGYCKIRQAGRFYYAFVGYNDVKQKEYADIAAKTAKNIHEFVKTFCDSLGTFYANNLAYIREKSPNNYRNLSGNNAVITEMPFFCFENGVPQVIIVRFINTTVGDEPINIRTRMWVNPPFFVLGYKREFLDVYPTDELVQQERNRIGSINLIKKAIAIEAEAHPNIVGGPIYVMRLTATYKEWIDGIEPSC